MNVKFVRHGETDLNKPIKRMQGISNYDLNDNGIKQAQTIRDKLADQKFDIIITSPLKRAKHTAEIINECQNVNIIIDDRLIERNYGKLEGCEFHKEYCDLSFDFEKVGGESMSIYKTRLKDFMDDVKRNYSSKKVLVVSHNGVISIISWILNGEAKNGNFENCGIENGEVKEFEF